MLMMVFIVINYVKCTNIFNHIIINIKIDCLDFPHDLNLCYVCHDFLIL